MGVGASDYGELGRDESFFLFASGQHCWSWTGRVGLLCNQGAGQHHATQGWTERFNSRYLQLRSVTRHKFNVNNLKRFKSQKSIRME